MLLGWLNGNLSCGHLDNKKDLDNKKILDNKNILAMKRLHQEIYHTSLMESPGPDFKTALPSQYLLLFWLSLTNTSQVPQLT